MTDIASTNETDSLYSLGMRRFADAQTASSYLDHYLDGWGASDIETLEDAADGRLVTVHGRRAIAIVGDEVWDWYADGDDDQERAANAREEFNAIRGDRGTPVPGEALSALTAGTTPLVYLDTGELARTMQDDESSEYYEGEVEVFEPLRWFVAGLRWDGAAARRVGMARVAR